MSNFPQFNVNNEHQLIRRQNTYVLDRKLISFHSQDRDVSQWPYANNFEVTLPETLNNVQSMRLVEIELPGNQYVFSNNQQNIKMQFYIIPNVSTETSIYLALEAQSTVPYEITIQEGFFTPSEMATELQNLMNQAVTNFLVNDAGLSGAVYDKFSVYYDQVGQKMYFGNTFDNFQFNFTEKITYDVPCDAIVNDNQPNDVWYQYANWGLPSYLGFNKAIYNPIDISSNFSFEYASFDWLIPNTSILPPTETPHAYYISAPNTICMFGDSAIYMEIDKYNTMDELYPYPMRTANTYNNDYNGKVNSAFAKIPITTTPNSQIFDSRNGFLQNVAQYHPPIDKIKKLKFKFRYHDGRLVEFKDCNFNFTIAFNQLKDEIARDYVVRVPAEYNL